MRLSLACLAGLLAAATPFGLVPPLRAQEPAPIDASVQEFVSGFKGRGALEDGSQPLTPQQTIERFRLAPGLRISVAAHEPAISQPLNLFFDERSRLWVVQYLQYPFPAGLKVLKYDEHLRAVFDKVPPPPPHHFKGKDRVTILEDRDGDGVYEVGKDFLSDLNMARSVVTGRGGVWVLCPPYLLFYPDANGDDVPDGDPEVRLSGFGLEDTHSGANSLHWGPDGWLYGAHGSTCSANVAGIPFLGQAIWRYHPEQKVFEVFAEGGGNTYCLEFDAEGRAFSGTNAGKTRGLHYPQGGAAVKTWSKHGPLMNPYSFGFYSHMGHQGYEPRFSQSLIKYEHGAIPSLEGQLFAPMSLQNRVMASQLLADGSTYRTVDLERPVVLTEDRWFRPVDTKVGPDGAIYMADWYDSRLTHVDPRDTWDKTHGRIYRLAATEGKTAKPEDFRAWPSAQLISLAKHPNKWHRQTALRLLYDRHEAPLAGPLRLKFSKAQGQEALETFWAIHACAGLSDELALEALGHTHAMVRYWAVRLMGDRYFPARYSSGADRPAPPLAAAVQARLVELAKSEPDAQVRGQLATSAKRFPAAIALPIVRALADRAEDLQDPHNPLLLWWALESKCAADRAAVLALWQEPALWQLPMAQTHLISRLGQRFTAERTAESLATAAQLLTLAPTAEATDALVRGMEAGLQGDRITAVPAALQQAVAKVWESRPRNATLLSFALRLNQPTAGEEAVRFLRTATGQERAQVLELLAERAVLEAVPVLLQQLAQAKQDAERVKLIQTLAQFEQADVATALLALLPESRGPVREAAIGALIRRPAGARALLTAVSEKQLPKEALSPTQLFSLQNLHDAETDALVRKLWGNLRPSSDAKQQRQKQVRDLLTKAGAGDPAKGQQHFLARCATCHTLGGQGGTIGPDLTGYERDNLDFMIPAIVDPSLGIREEYTAYTVATTTGQSLTGFITENDPQAVTLVDLGGAKTRVPRSEVKTLSALPTSIMPEGLLEGLTDNDLRDLFAYLMKK